MGYSTSFSGAFKLDQRLTVLQAQTLNDLADWDAVPPKDAPDSNCQWVVGSDNQSIGHNNDEKFYSWGLWLEYLIANYLKPWGLTLSGQVIWQGEDCGDAGMVFVKDNRIKTVHIEEMPEPDWDAPDGNDTDVSAVS